MMSTRAAPRSSSLRFPVQPRLVPPSKAARRLHLTLAEFEDKLPALMRAGFPAPFPVTGHFDLVAIDAWCDQRSGLGANSVAADAEAIMRERIARLG